MVDHTIPIAPIPLARSTGRMLLPPALLLVAGIAAVAGGASVGGVVGIALVAAGLIVASLSLYLAARLLTTRLDVEVATLRLSWLGGERRYTLVRGPVTRIALQGDEAASLRPRFGALGWAVGRARLRHQEDIDVVRLTPTASMILVPTERGRLGIAPASEEHLLSALSAAARIQQRLDEVAERARAFMDLPSVPDQAPPVREAVAQREGRRTLTGIERQLLEERLAAERAAALERAEAERLAAIQAAEAAALAPVVTEATTTGVAAREPRRGRWRRPAWLLGRHAQAEAGEVAAAAAAVRAADGVAEAPLEPMQVPEPVAIVEAPPMTEPLPMPAPVSVAETTPDAGPVPVAEPVTIAQASGAEAVPAAAPAEPARPRLGGDQLLAFWLALTPVVAAGAIWVIASVRGALPASVEELRPIALALLAVGPAGALAALAARAWYPRLQGLVTLTALTALVLVGRMLLA